MRALTFWGAYRLSVFRQPLFDGHHIGQFTVGLGPQVHDPFHASLGVLQNRRIVRCLADQPTPAKLRIGDRARVLPALRSGRPVAAPCLGLAEPTGGGASLVLV